LDIGNIAPRTQLRLTYKSIKLVPDAPKIFEQTVNVVPPERNELWILLFGAF
jgi:hypothetical protein